MNKRKRIGRQLLCLIVSFVMIMTLIPRMPGNLAYAAAGDVPAHTKNLTDNHDGTFTLSLDVVGDSEKKPNNINVVVILDRSGSMNSTRMNSAKSAIKSLSNKLYSYNTSTDPNTVEMALVTFSNVGEVAQRPTNSATTFNLAVDNVRATGGTNWEGALQIAKGVDFGDNDQTFVVFVSDGNPTFRFTEGNYPNHYNDYNSTYYYNYGVWGTGDDDDATTVARCYEHAVDDAKALAQQVGVNNFFTIGAFGNVDRMKSLTTDAGAPAKNYYSASDSAALNQAISDILAKIEMAGIANAEIDDGTTNKVTTTSGKIAKLLEVDESSFKYYKGGSAWADAPEAHLVNGTVEWDLESAGVLENGVRYTVTFDCYPSQYTYDTIAKLKNGDITYDSLDSEIKKYIADLGEGNYGLRTNTDATLSYDDTRDDAGVQTVGYKNPDPVATDAATMSVTKKWENELDARKVGSIDMTVLMGEEEFHKVTLTDPSWKQEGIFISPGIIKNGKVLPGAEGHDFTFAELGSEQYNWELVAPTVHPMLIDGDLTMLTMVDDAHTAPTGAQTYTINGKTYFSNGSSTASLDAYNYRRSNLNLTKVVTGEDAPKDATFPFTLTVNNSKSPKTEPTDDPEHNSDYWVWFSIYDTKAGATVTDATVSAAGLVGPNDDGYYYAPSGTAITVNMKDGWNLRFTNLPTATTYTFAEGDLADGFAFNKATLSGGEDSTFSGGKTTTGTVENTNTSYTVTYTNDYQLTDLEITKVWDDANNQDGKRLTADELKAKLTLSPAVDGKDATVVDNGDGTYTITYKDLPRFNNGTEVEYTVTESEIDGYTTTENTAKDHGTIINKHTPETTEATVVKVWNDSDNQDGKRPTNLVVTLSNGDNVTLNEGNNWTATVPNLPKYSNGTEIEYTWTEGDMPEGYSLTSTSKKGTVTTLTNSYTPETTTVNAEKIWKSGSTTLTEAPEDITLHLNKKVGTADATVVTGQDKTIAKGASGDDLKVSWTGLPKYEAGQLITYTVTEDNVAGYTTTITGNAANGFVITNSNVTVEDAALLSKTITAVNPAAASTFGFTAVEVTVDEETGDVTEVEDGWTGTGEVTFEANEGDDPKTVTFGDITYGEPGVHYYKVTETTVPAGWTATYPGGKDYALAKVTVNKNETTGELSTVVENADISNAYAVQPTTITLGASKKLDVESGNNAPDVSKKYDLILKSGNTTIESVKNPDGDGTEVKFKELTFSAAGTYTYTVTEHGSVDGVTNEGCTADKPHEDVVKTVVVTVTDNGNGTLTAAVTSGAQVTEFKNTYNVAPTSIELKASKTLAVESGNNPPNVSGAYDLTLTAKNGAPMPEGATNGSIYKKNIDGEGTAVSFGSIPYTAPGTYSYTVTESGSVAGVENGTASCDVTVTVTDNGDGTLTAAVTSGSQTTAFVNTYKVTPVTITPEASKALVGRTLKEGEFSFTLSGNGVNETKTNDANGGVTFSDITYNAPGTFTYTISEEKGTLDKVTYDESVKTMVVEVTDDGKGHLAADVKYDGAATKPVFTNTYTPDPTSATISVNKALEGRNLNAGEFSFTMTQTSAPEGAPEFEDMTATNSAVGEGETTGLVQFDPISYSVAGTYVYEITEDPGDLGGVTYSTETVEVTVEVTYDADAGTYSAEVTYPEDKTFNNTYSPAPTSAAFEAKKVLEGRPLNAEEFEFTLSDSTGTLQTKTNAADGTVSFDSISYSAVGTYTYTIKETKGRLGGVTYDEHETTVTVEVTDDKIGNLHAAVSYSETVTLDDGTTNTITLAENEVPTFTNEYAPASVKKNIEVDKVLTGRAQDAGEFSFSLLEITKDEDGEETSTLVDTAVNTADGIVAFDEIEYTEVGEHKYNVVENIPEETKGITYDSQTMEVTVSVTDDLNGNLVASVTYPEDKAFKNTYEATGVFNPETKKILEGKDLEDGEFSFKIEGPAGKLPATTTVTNKADGTVKFGNITFDENDIGKTYEYTISEVAGDERFVTYDSNKVILKVTVVDNKDGTLRFNTEYGEISDFTNIFKIIYGNLNINKTLDTIYDVDAENKDDVNTTVVFSVKAVLDGEKVYDDVVAIDFSNGGTLPAEIVEKIPVGSVVTVEEIYCSGSYKLTAGPEPTTVTIEEEGQTVAINFTNTYDNKLIQGYGILNEYSKEEGKDWIHNGSQEKEAED